MTHKYEGVRVRRNCLSLKIIIHLIDFQRIECRFERSFYKKENRICVVSDKV